MRLSAAMIFVKDFDRMVAFYRDTLRLPLVEDTRMADWAEFDTGTARLSLHAIPAHHAADITISSPPQPREESPTKLFLETADAEAEIARLEALGVPVIRRPWGGRDLIDPEGNILALVTAP